MATVLIVDDEQGVRLAVSELIRRKGHVVTECGGVQDALVKLRNHPYDLVLTDFQLLDGDGETVVYAAQALCPKAQRALMTGNVQAIPRSLVQAVHHILEKPLLYGELGNVLANLRAASSATP